MSRETGTRRNNNAIMTPKDVTTSFRRHNDVIIASCAHWGMATDVLFIMTEWM